MDQSVQECLSDMTKCNPLSYLTAPVNEILHEVLWLRTAAAHRKRKSQVAVAIALQSVNTKEASNVNGVNERCKILRSPNRVFVFEIVLCIGAPSKDPARFVDLGFWILRNKEAQEYKPSSQETNHNKCVSAAYDCLVSARSIVCFLFSGLLSCLDWQSLLLVCLLVSPGACWFYRKPKHSSKQYMQDTHIPRR